MKTLTKNKMKVGLYGGSFNPIHFGHMEVMNEVLDRNIVDEVWLMPCRNHVFHKNLASIDDRIAMLNIATSGMENVRIEDLEAKSESESRTANSLRKLRRNNHDKEFYLITGSDSVNDIDKWYDAAYIKRTTPFIVVERKGYVLNKDIGVKFEEVLKRVSPISSTDIRERVYCNLSLKGLLPKDVAQYIMDHGIYTRPQSEGALIYVNPATTADLIVPIDGGLLYVKRKDEPFKGYWAFPGGFLEGNETLKQTGARELFEETRIKANPTDLEFLNVYDEPGRDPRGNVISHAYVVKNYTGTPHASDDALEVRVFKEKPEHLAFDHSKVYDDYKAKYKL